MNRPGRLASVVALEASAQGFRVRYHSDQDGEPLLQSMARSLRTLLIQGARSMTRTAQHKHDRLSRWATALAGRSQANMAAAALADKTARIAGAMLRNGTDHQADRVP